MDTLLSTKLFIPQPGPKVIARPRLITRLERENLFLVRLDEECYCYRFESRDWKWMGLG